jgi:hypothetical protein
MTALSLIFCKGSHNILPCKQILLQITVSVLIKISKIFYCSKKCAKKQLKKFAQQKKLPYICRLKINRCKTVLIPHSIA